MANYSYTYVRYRGRRVRINTRYGGFFEAYVVKGKPLRFSLSIWDGRGFESSRRVWQLAMRRRVTRLQATWGG